MFLAFYFSTRAHRARLDVISRLAVLRDDHRV